MLTAPPGALDSLDMFGALGSTASQMTAARAVTEEADLAIDAHGISSVLVLGMGGSGIGGDVCAAVAAPLCDVPVLVSKHYECPGFVGPDTLVVAMSFSGNTEETLTAASAAAAAGARMVVVATGGELVARAADWGAAVVGVDPGIPMPRAGLGAMSVVPMVLLERLGLASGLGEQIDTAAAQVERRLGAPATPTDALHLARQVGRTLPLVYGGGQLGEAAAWRWKGQFNENPKVPSWANRVPELTHNEICGWAQHGDVTRQVFSLLLLRHDHEHPQVSKRFALIEEISEEIVGAVHTVRAEGPTAYAQFMDLVVFGDLVTLLLATESGVDPGPVPILDDIKSRLRA